MTPKHRKHAKRLFAIPRNLMALPVPLDMITPTRVFPAAMTGLRMLPSLLLHRLRYGGLWRHTGLI